MSYANRAGGKYDPCASFVDMMNRLLSPAAGRCKIRRRAQACRMDTDYPRTRIPRRCALKRLQRTAKLMIQPARCCASSELALLEVNRHLDDDGGQSWLHWGKWGFVVALWLKWHELVVRVSVKCAVSKGSSP